MAGFQVLNDPSAGNNAASFVEQARLDSGDMSTLAAGIGGNGVISGCEVVTYESGLAVGTVTTPTVDDAPDQSLTTVTVATSVANETILIVASGFDASEAVTVDGNATTAITGSSSTSSGLYISTFTYSAPAAGSHTVEMSASGSYNFLAAVSLIGVGQIATDAGSTGGSNVVTLTQPSLVCGVANNGAGNSLSVDGTIVTDFGGNLTYGNGVSSFVFIADAGTYTITDTSSEAAYFQMVLPLPNGGATNGIALIDGEQITVSPTVLAVATPDDTNDRVDLVVAGSDGTCSIVEGTPAAVAVWPTIPASSVLLAAVTVPASDTSGTRSTAPLFRDSASTQGTPVTIPDSIQVGDLLFGFYLTVAAVPDGWNALPTSTWAGSNSATIYSCYRVAESGDAGTSVTLGSGYSNGVVAFYNVDTDLFESGASGATPTEGVSNTSSNGGAGTQSTAGVAAADAYSLIVGAFSYCDNQNTGDVTISSPATSLLSNWVSSRGLAVGSLAGSTSDQTITATADGGGWATSAFILEGAISSALTADNIVDKRVFVSSPVVGNVPSVASSAPSAMSVGFYFDTTLSQLGISDGSYWHYYTETSNTIPPANPSYIDGAVGGFSEGSATITIPEDVEVGDELVAGVNLLFNTEGTPACTQPDGWTVGPVATVGLCYLFTFTKQVEAGDAGSVITINLTDNGSPMNGQRTTTTVADYRGVATIASCGDNFTSVAGGTSLESAPVTSTTAYATIVNIFALASDNGEDSFTLPATSRLTVGDVNGSGGTGYSAMGLCDEAQDATGANTQVTATNSLSDSDVVCVSFSLMPASS